MGRVSLALDRESGQFVAVKRLHEAVALQGGVRLRREFKSLERIAHENVVKVLGFGEESGLPYLVMEFVRGTDLNDWLKHNPPLEKLIEVFAGISSALSAVHAQGIVHRDLKPENVRVTEDGNAKLMDFGLAKSLEGSVALTREGAVVGTVLYMAPEQCRGQQLDYRADLYALGAVLFSALTGRPPFVGEGIVQVIMQHIQSAAPAPKTFNPNIPESLNALVQQMLAKNPLERPQSALAVKEALLASLAVNVQSTQEITSEIARADAILIAPLIGRDAQMAELLGFLETETGVIALTGDVGSGKTRMLRALNERLQADGTRLLIAESIPEDPTPFGTISRLIASLEKHHGHVIGELSEGAKSELARISPYIRLAIPNDINLPPEVARLKLFEAFTELLEALSKTSILAFENLHWADSSTLEMLAHSSRALENTKMIITYRLEDLPENATHPKGLKPKQSLNLESLSEALTLELLRALMDDELDPALEAELVSRAGGNPWVLEERLKAMLESGAVYRRAGVYEWNRNLTGLPESLNDLLSHRIAALPQPALEFARAASVLGRAFFFEDARNLLEWSDDAALDSLETLARAKLISETPGTNGEGFRFTHPSYAELIGAGLMSLKRRRLHAKAALLLEERAAPLELTEHLLEAGLFERALVKGLEAGLDAQNTFAYPQAERAYRMALTASEKLEGERLETMHVRNHLAEVLSFMGLNDEAVSLWKTVMQSAELLEGGLAVALRARVSTAKALRLRGSLDEALSLVGQPKRNEPMYAALCLEQSAILRNLQDVVRAKHSGLEALSAFKLDKDAIGQTLSISGLATIEREQGRLPRSEYLLKLAIRLAEQSQNYHLLANVWNELGLTLREQYQIENATSAWEKAVAAAEKIGDVKVEIVLGINIALAEMDKGEFVQAKSRLEHSSVLIKRSNLYNYQSYVVFNTAICEYALGNLEFSRLKFEEIHDQQLELSAKGWITRITLELGDGFFTSLPILDISTDEDLMNLLEVQHAISFGNYQKAFEISRTPRNDWFWALAGLHAAWRLGKQTPEMLETVLHPPVDCEVLLLPKLAEDYKQFASLVFQNNWNESQRATLRILVKQYQACAIGLLARDVALSLTDEA
jgi:tetratricopeptide (TPR) repeat protein